MAVHNVKVIHVRTGIEYGELILDVQKIHAHERRVKHRFHKELTYSFL